MYRLGSLSKSLLSLNCSPFMEAPFIWRWIKQIASNSYYKIWIILLADLQASMPSVVWYSNFSSQVSELVCLTVQTCGGKGLKTARNSSKCKKSTFVPVNAEEAYRWSNGTAPLILNPVATWWQVAPLPLEKTPGTYWMRGWVGPRAGLGVLEEETVSYLRQNLNIALSSPNLSLQLSYSEITGP
jgi:hypothetical protein